MNYRLKIHTQKKKIQNKKKSIYPKQNNITTYCPQFCRTNCPYRTLERRLCASLCANEWVWLFIWKYAIFAVRRLASEQVNVYNIWFTLFRTYQRIWYRHSEKQRYDDYSTEEKVSECPCCCPIRSVVLLFAWFCCFAFEFLLAYRNIFIFRMSFVASYQLIVGYMCLYASPSNRIYKRCIHSLILVLVLVLVCDGFSEKGKHTNCIPLSKIKFDSSVAQRLHTLTHAQTKHWPQPKSVNTICTHTINGTSSEYYT